MLLSHLTSPIGDMLLVTDTRRAVLALDFADHKARLYRGLRERLSRVDTTAAPASPEISEALGRYFAGEFDALNVIKTETVGSEMQCQVWTAVRRIEAGTTTTYGKLAKELGFDDPRAAIDVGAANGANPVAIIVPCHRVIASTGELKGYAWGLHRKRWLLEHEKAIAPTNAEPRTATLPGFRSERRDCSGSLRGDVSDYSWGPAGGRSRRA
jgi:methylated-DNA-[protein]-cysteine S-methyltransferase